MANGLKVARASGKPDRLVDCLALAFFYSMAKWKGGNSWTKWMLPLIPLYQIGATKLMKACTSRADLLSFHFMLIKFYVGANCITLYVHKRKKKVRFLSPYPALCKSSAVRQTAATCRYCENLCSNVKYIYALQINILNVYLHLSTIRRIFKMKSEIWLIYGGCGGEEWEKSQQEGKCWYMSRLRGVVDYHFSVLIFFFFSTFTWVCGHLSICGWEGRW